MLTEINRSQKQIVLDTRCLSDTHTYTIVSGTAEYALPADFMCVVGVTHKQLDLLPTAKNILDFYAGVEDWTDDEGTPTEYYVGIKDPDTTSLFVYPIPQSADAGPNLLMEYLVAPADMSADADVPFNSHTLLFPYHEAIVHDVVQRLLAEDEMTPKIIQKIGYHQLERDKIYQKIERTFKNAQNKPLRLRGGRKWKY